MLLRQVLFYFKKKVYKVNKFSFISRKTSPVRNYIPYYPTKCYFLYVISLYSWVITLFLVWRNLPHSSASTPRERKTHFLETGNWVL